MPVLTPAENLAREVALKQLVDEVGAFGVANDTQTTGMMKGIGGALGRLAALLKGKAPPPGDDDEPDGDEAPPAKSKKDDEDDEPPPGAPMYKGNGGDGGEQYIDGTALMVELDRRTTALAKALDESRADGRALRKLVKALNAKLDGMIEADSIRDAANIEIQGQLAKGVGHMLGATMRTPEASPTAIAGRLDVKAAIAAQIKASREKGGVEIDQIRLSKGMRQGIISEANISYYNKTGRLHTDDAQHDDMAAKVLALAV